MVARGAHISRLLLLGAAALALGLLAGSSLRAGAAAARCVPSSAPPRITSCGPATATLSAFPGARFSGGVCKRSTADGQLLLNLDLGTVAVTSPATNLGLASFQLTLSGPVAHPSAGHVTAFWKGRRWSGTGTQFTLAGTSGRFVLSADPPARGTATGTFRC